jgi:hypothetical protein
VIADTFLLTVPTDLILDVRKGHNLRYHNWREYDYTYAQFPVIPHVIGLWAEDGLTLDEDFIQRLWRDHADKVDGHERGEMMRTSKLVLDALKAVYDQSAFAEFTGCQVMYRPSDDMRGRDLTIHVPGVGPVWLQMRVMINGDYRAIKRRRQMQRNGEELDVIDACATLPDLETSKQPYLPMREWYVRTINDIKTPNIPTAASLL